MSFAHIAWQEKSQIIPSTHLSILYAMLDTWKRCNSPEEPDFVAGIVLESTPILYQAISSIFGQYGLSVSLASVFCHQTPKVVFPGMNKSSCEIGDLLLVHIHTPRTGYPTRNALLYQAKMSSSQPYRVGSGEKDQLELYTEWPAFKYVNSPPLTGQTRDVIPKMKHTGAQYMLIDDRPPNDPNSGLLGLPGTYPIGSCMADDHLRDHNHFADEFFDFLILRSGRGFSAQSSATDGWSQIVWDLLDVGFQKAFNRRRSGRVNQPRHAGATREDLDGCSCFQRTTEATSSTLAMLLGGDRSYALFADNGGEPPGERFRNENGEEPESGVSIILIETSERHDERG